MATTATSNRRAKVLYTILAVLGLAALAIIGAATGAGTANPGASARDWSVEHLKSPRDSGPWASEWKMTPGREDPKLIVFVDARKVLGWVSSRGSFAGREVTVRVGDRTESVVVQADNTFTWHYAVPAANQPATFALAGTPALTASALLTPAEKLEPSVFFVVDRSVYRPRQTLNFVAFLRRLDENGRFVPMANQSVEVVLKAVKKNAVAAKIKLTSDDQGRLTGSYAFAPEDVLDDYTLTVAGHRGQAQVKLAEFRKAKVRLHIEGKQEAGKLRLRLEARDFLDKPVPAQRMQFTATVVRKGRVEKVHALDASQFAYRDGVVRWLPDEDGMTEEERFLWLHAGAWPSAGQAVLSQASQQIELKGDSACEHELPLSADWQDGKCVVLVQGVLVDQNGQEQRCGKSIVLERRSSAAVGGLSIALPRWQFYTDETVPLTVRWQDANGRALDLPANATVTAVRTAAVAGPGGAAAAHYPAYALSSMVNQAWGYDDQMAYSSARAYPSWRYPRSWGYYAPAAATAADSVVTASALVDGKATLSLEEPGLYRLVAIVRTPGKGQLRREAVCAVAQAGSRPGMLLRLDSEQMQTGDVMAGQLQARVPNAPVLLTIRDGRGLRLWRTFTTGQGAVRFAQRLPEDLSFGCTVSVHCVDAAGVVQAAAKNIRVKPNDRLLEIKTAIKETVEPGEKVKIDLEVNRRESVDLVVSVYDKNLLGIAADVNHDIRNFYLADERAFERGGMDLLLGRLGSLTFEELHAKACGDAKLLDANLPWQAVRQAWANGCVQEQNLQAILACAGVTARVVPWYQNWYCYIKKDKGAANRLADMLRSAANGWRLTCRLYDSLPVLVAVHPQYNPSMGYRAAGAAYDMRDARARGDAFQSASANAMYSNLSAQSFISHLPSSPDVPLLEPDSATLGGVLRRDFSDSAYWNASVRTDAAGRASVEFKVPDSLTNWDVVVTAVSRDMHVGHQTAAFRTYRPIMVWPMIPRVFTTGDKVRVFARVHNRTDKAQTMRVALKVENGEVLDRPETSVTVAPRESEAVYWTFAPGKPGYTQLLMTAECEAGSDASVKRLPVVPACAVEEVVTSAGFCGGKVTFIVPEERLAQSNLEITLVGSLAADMMDTLPYLVEYPHGCVEQTMSRFLPAIKVAGILKKLGVRNEKLAGELPRCVEGGIKRLLALQQGDGGWGWNGSGQTHEMMTPYALWGLLEAERSGYTIADETAIDKALTRLRQFIDNMGENQAADRIYCMYVYGFRKPMEEKWWTFMGTLLDKERISDYAAALALELAARNGKKALAAGLAARLEKTARKDGDNVFWTTAGFSRWSEDPHEITAAVLKALTAHDAEHPLIAGILNYFASTKNGNRWNSTKDTAMILFAMSDYIAAKDLKLGGESRMAVRLNDGEARKVEMGALAKKVTIPAGQVKAGKNTVTFDGAGAGVMYRLVFRYQKVAGDSAPWASGLKVERTFDLYDKTGKHRGQVKPGESIPRGSYLLATVRACSVAGESMRYVLVESPKPSCAEIVPVEDTRFQQGGTQYVLREDRTAAVLYHHESTGGSLEDRAVFLAEMAGEYTIPPAYAELMYSPATRGHSGTFKVKVVDGE